MSDDLTQAVVAWAAQIARDAARLSSRQARDAYFAERRRELMDGALAQGAAHDDAAAIADASVDAAWRILNELLAQRAAATEGQA